MQGCNPKKGIMNIATTDTQQLTPVQRRAIDALVDTSYNIAEAAQRTGIEHDEILMWLCRDLAFVAALSDAMESRLDEAFHAIVAELEWEWTNNAS